MIGPLQRKLVRDLWGRKGSLIALLVLYAAEDFLRNSGDLQGAWNQIDPVSNDPPP